MITLVQDIRHSIRLLVKSPAFKLVVVTAIALGIGPNTAIFSVVNTVLLRPLPYPDPERLVVLSELDPDRKTRMAMAYPNLRDWRAQSQSYDQIAGYRGRPMSLTGVDQPANLNGRMVSTGFFEVLGVSAIRGRTIAASDDTSTAPPVVCAWLRALA